MRAAPRTALIVAVANNMGANAALESLTDATRTAVITALAHTAVAERELNDTARNRTSTITVRTVGGGAAAASWVAPRSTPPRSPRRRSGHRSHRPW